MAKRGTLTHRRTRRIAAALGIELPYALGLMEALFHVTADKAPAGDIGRLTDQDIADEMFFRGDAAQLVTLLVQVGALEQPEGSPHRLLVHGWGEHADDSVRKKLHRAHLTTFADGSPVWPKKHRDQTAADHGAPPEDDGEPQPAAGRPPSQAVPGLAKPSQAVTDLAPPAGDAQALSPRVTWLTPYVEAWRDRWGRESQAPTGEMAKHLREAEAQLHGDRAECVARWRMFLAHAEQSQWARPARFLQGLGEWAEGKARASPGRARGVTAGNVAAAERFLGSGGQRE